MQPGLILTVVFSLLVVHPVSGQIAGQQQPNLPPLRPAQTSPAYPSGAPVLQPASPTATFSDMDKSIRPDTPPPAMVSPPAESSILTFNANELRQNAGGLTPAPNRAYENQNRSFPGSLAAANEQIPAVPSLRQLPDSPTDKPFFDDQLQPAGYTSTQVAGGATPVVISNLASDLIQELQIDPAIMAIPGQPVTLVEMTANCIPQRRADMVQQYWKTYQAWADYRLALDQLQWLQQLGQPRMAVDGLTLDAAISSASNDVDEKKLRLGQHQAALNRYWQGPRTETALLPADMPLVGKYRTNFDIYAAHAAMPQRLRLIHQWLPHQHALIQKRADTVQRCRAAVGRTSDAFKQGSIRLGSALTAVELYGRNHTAFIRSVIDYNANIANYALMVQPHQTTAEKVVAMLIPRRRPAVIDTVPPNARQARLDAPAYNAYGQRPADSVPSSPLNDPWNSDRGAQSNSGRGIAPATLPGLSNPAQQPPQLDPWQLDPRQFDTRQPSTRQLEPRQNDPRQDNGFENGSLFQPSNVNSPFRR